METQKILQIQDVTADQLTNMIGNAVKNEITSLRAELSQNKESEKLLSPDEVCEMLGISKVSLWAWSKSGKLTAYGIGAKRWYKEGEILNISLKQKK